MIRLFVLIYGTDEITIRKVLSRLSYKYNGFTQSLATDHLLILN